MKKILNGLLIAFLLATTLILGWDKYQERKLRLLQRNSEASQYPKISVPVQKQWKGEFNLDNGVTLSNDFDGARLNGAVSTNDTLVTVLITPENTPVKVNPWYAFKVWSEESKEIYLKFTYPDEIEHRYYPKVSSDGINWTDLDREKIVSYPGSGDKAQSNSADNDAIIRITSRPDTLWIAANEVVTSTNVESWVDSLSMSPFVSTEIIGTSKMGKPLYSVEIKGNQAKKHIIVLARQYPSMSVGSLAMQSFIDQLTQNSDLANEFRSNFNVILYPLINPDGADQGNWSHSMGGINLTEDWGETKQPEIFAIKTHIESLAKNDDDSFYLNIDIRSNRESILYVYNADSTNRMNALTMDIAESVDDYLAEYTPTIKTRQSGKDVYIAEDYFFKEYGMESLVVIIDEDSSQDLIDKKGKALATSVMEHLKDL